ncbi:hypothetical protein LOAG_17219 [Loa loa]|uniref:Uncharacterized protein n=1 Tax=Loa loa TaxID=7209 RepID=A0A1S0ULN2_LOALO|nr:hypothetical protein LOAG_17219 [Loa loa]EJD75694.1 hypothetical protein LOAG_17219 [Loa loa]
MAMSIQETHSYRSLNDDSVLSMSSAAGITHEPSMNSTIDSSTNSSTKLSSFLTQNAHEELDSKPYYSSVEGMDITQSDAYDIFANKLVKHLIENLRAKYLHEDYARVILMRRGETVSEVFTNWTVNAFDDSNLYVS